MAAVALSAKSVGSLVKIKENGVLQDFYVAKHGYPTAGNGRTLLVRRYIYDLRMWHATTVNAYASSDIDSWLTGTYYGLIASDIQGWISTVSIPYTPGNGNKTLSTLSRKVFLLSLAELGWAKDDANYEGEALSICGTLRIARISVGSIAYPQWTRTPFKSDTTSAWVVNESGGSAGYFCNSSGVFGARPAFALQSHLLVLDDGSVAVNKPPTIPPSITIPDTINGGVQFPVSWGAATDPDGNLAGYKLERQLNGGAWSQIFQADALTTNDTVAFGTNTAAYRVRAYDTEGEASAFQTSPTRTITNNRAPNVPPKITVPPTAVGGEPLEIIWTAATDPDGDAVTYQLQRSSDGGATFTQVYAGAALTFTDTITRGWPSVQYRVRAVDPGNEVSEWKTSTTRAVDNTVPPTIASGTSGDMGLKNQGFVWQYTVTQEDSQETVVTESIDGAVMRTYTAVLGQLNTFDVSGMRFMALLNGQHVMQITAVSKGKSAAYTVTFTKGVYALCITLSAPLTADAPITKMVMNVTRSIPEGAAFQVLATNNANDAEPVWEDITPSVLGNTNHVFSNKICANGAAFNLKVIASREIGDVGGFISSIGGAFE